MLPIGFVAYNRIEFILTLQQARNNILYQITLLELKLAESTYEQSIPPATNNAGQIMQIKINKMKSEHS